MDETHYTLMFDGGSRGNPGKCGCGFIILNDVIVVHEGYELVSDNNTNNFAEYMALILGLELAIKNNIKILHIIGDSMLVVNQLTGKWKVHSDNIKPLFNKANKLLKSFEFVTLKHVKRDKNKLADALANKAMDN